MRYMGSVSWMRYLMAAGIMFAVALVIFMYTNYDTNYMSDLLSFLIFIPYTLAIYCFMTSCFANMITGFRSKKDNDLSQLLLLPSSNIEKFISALIMNVALPTFLCAVAFHLAGLIALPEIFGTLVSKGGLVAIYAFASGIDVDMFGSFEGNTSLATTGVKISLYIFPLFISAIYMLGGMLFCRAKWLLTTLSMLLIHTVIAHAVVGFLSTVDFNAYTLNIVACAWWPMAIESVVIVAFVWLSYRLFKRRQTANGAFFNV